MTPLQRQLPKGTREAAAEHLGCSVQHLNGICQGRLTPSWDLALKLSHYLGGRLSAEGIRGEAVPEGARVRASEPAPDPSSLSRSPAATGATAHYSCNIPTAADLTPPRRRGSEAA